jgi:site-specific DNA recombinase
VQRLLDEKRTAGERPQIHRHYLRGSVFCGACAKRLVYGLSTGKSDRKYAYYFCAARINGGDCPQRVIRPELIEVAIQRYYREHPVQLSTSDVERRSQAIEALSAVSQQAVIQIREAKTELIGSLEVRQEALLDMRLAEQSISPALFKRKQDQLQAEMDAAHESLAQSEQQLAIDTEHL